MKSRESPDTLFATVTIFPAEEPKTCALLPGRDNRCLWGPPSLLFNGKREFPAVVKRPTYEAGVKNVWRYTSIPTCAFMACTGTTLTFLNIVVTICNTTFKISHTLYLQDVSYYGLFCDCKINFVFLRSINRY